MLNGNIFKKALNSLEETGILRPGAKPQTPDRLYIKCDACKAMLLADELREHLYVCPKCGAHMRISARDRIHMLFDEGSFQEWDADLLATDFLHFPGYPEKLAEYREKSGEKDGVVTGLASIGGHPCAIFVMDPGFMIGSMGTVIGEKITRVFERAAQQKLPVIGFTVSDGARMQEGTTSLMQMAKVSGAVKRHSDQGGLYIAVLTDPTSGGVTASFAMEADVLMAEPGALIAFAGPRVIEQTIHKKLPAGFQRAEFLLEHGFLDKIVTRDRLRVTLKRLLGYHRQEDGSYGRL